MRVLLLSISAATYLVIGAALLFRVFQAGQLPAAGSPAVPQAVAAAAARVPAPHHAAQALTSRSARTDEGTVIPIIRVKTVRVDPEDIEVEEQPPRPEATEVPDPSTSTLADEPAATMPARETDRAPAVPPPVTKTARATRGVVAKTKTKAPADEPRASDDALSFAPQQPDAEPEPSRPASF
jgi:hypothetical protein